MTCMTVSAQSAMTDEQVIKFVMKEQKAGSTQQEIAVKLVQKGVTTDQIKRVQKKVERLKKDEGLGAVGDKTLGTDKRQRKANGDPKNDNNSSQRLKDKSPRRIVSLDDEEDPEDTEDYKAGLLKKDMDVFMPDSFDLYDRKVIQDYLKAKDEYENGYASELCAGAWRCGVYRYLWGFAEKRRGHHHSRRTGYRRGLWSHPDWWPHRGSGQSASKVATEESLQQFADYVLGGTNPHHHGQRNG